MKNWLKNITTIGLTAGILSISFATGMQADETVSEDEILIVEEDAIEIENEESFSVEEDIFNDEEAEEVVNFLDNEVIDDNVIDVEIEEDHSSNSDDIIDSGTCGDDLTWTLDSENESSQQYIKSFNPQANAINVDCSNGTFEIIFMEEIDFTGSGYAYLYETNNLKRPLETIPLVKDSNNAFVLESESGGGRDELEIIFSTTLDSGKEYCIQIDPGAIRFVYYDYVICNYVDTGKVFSGLTDTTWSFKTSDIANNSDDIVDNGTCGDNLTWTLDSEGTLTISGTGPMYTYATNGSPFCAREDIRNIKINNGVTVIANYAFQECSSLTNITIPDSVTSIRYSAFENCSSLTSVTIPDGVSYIGDNLFYYCSSLTSVTIPDSVTSIGERAFYSCSSLTNITIPDSVNHIGNHAFHNCSNLTSITIPDNVSSIGDAAFYNCSSLTSITIPDSMTYIPYYAFYNCSSLTSVTIPDSVTSIGDSAFDNCSSLTSIRIPNGVTRIGIQTFYNCSSLTNITIPDSVTSIGYSAFAICSSLTSVTIPDSVTSIGYSAFYNCSSLMSITIPGSVTSIPNAFHGCSRLTSVTILDGVTSIGDSAFDNCSSLTNITIPDSVTSIGERAFYSCSSLTSIRIPNGVTSIGIYAFYNCSSLTSITIPGGLTSTPNAFHGCSRLTSVTILDGVTSIDPYTFQSCSSLTNITIPDSVTSIGKFAFDECRSLTKITIPNSVTSIEDNAFFNCSSLTSITIPGSVTSTPDAFYGCSRLTSVTILDSVTSIGKNAFWNCSSLTSITIPDSVTSIGECAFSYCKSLTSIYFEGTKAEWNKIDIGYGNEYLKNATIHFNSNATTKLTIEKDSYEIVLGDIDDCYITAFYLSDEEPQNISWTCSDPNAVAFARPAKAATVDKDGKKIWNIFTGVLTKKLGDYELTLTVDGAMATTTVKIVKEKSNESSFSLANDTWNFGNLTSRIPLSRFRMFFKYLPNAVIKHFAENGTHGQCVGMALAAASAYKGFPSTLWSDKMVLHDVNESDYSTETNCSASDFIGYAHAYQFVRSYQEEREDNMYNVANGENKQLLDNLRDSVEAFQVGHGDPVIISIGTYSQITNKNTGFSFEDKFPHALLGYKIEEETDSYTKIAVYDSNLPYDPNHLNDDINCIVLYGRKGNYSGWSYDFDYYSLSYHLGSEKEDANISYIIPAQNFINDYDSSYAYEDTNILLKIGMGLTGYIEFASTGTGNIALDLLPRVRLKDIITPIIVANGVDEDPDNCYWLKDNNIISFTGLSGAGDIYLGSEEMGMTVNPPEDCDLSVDLSKGETNFSNCKGDNINIVYEHFTDYESSTVTAISGVSDGDSKITVDEMGNTIFTGLEDCDITLGAQKDYDDWSVTTELIDEEALSELDPSKEYIVYDVQDEYLEIYEDQDGNGTFETPVTNDASIKVSETSVTLCSGSSSTITVSNLAIGDEVVSWTSADETIASVDINGMIEGIKQGETVVTVTLLSGLTADVAVSVVEHTAVRDEAVSPTCIEDGKTEGSHCSVCGTTLVEQETVPATGHKWDGGKVTKYATTVASGVKTYTCSVCGETKTETLPKLSAKEAEGDPKDSNSVAGTEQAMKTVKDSGEPEGSSFAAIRLQSKEQTKTTISLSWNKVKGAAGYIVYGSKCGKNNKLKRIAKLTENSYKYKKLKKGTYYKFTVVAYKTVKGKEQVIASSKMVHVATTGGKVTNVKKVTAKVKNKAVTKLTLKKKKTATIKTTTTLQNKTLKLKDHRLVRFESSNPKIAKVNSKGKVTAKKKGKCYIYAYSQNGTYAKIAVTVK